MRAKAHSAPEPFGAVRINPARTRPGECEKDLLSWTELDGGEVCAGGFKSFAFSAKVVLESHSYLINPPTLAREPCELGIVSIGDLKDGF